VPHDLFVVLDLEAKHVQIRALRGTNASSRTGGAADKLCPPKRMAELGRKGQVVGGMLKTQAAANVWY